MDDEIDATLLAKYLAGECSEDEVNRVLDWISQEPDASERMARLQQIWESTRATSSQWNADEAWEKLHQRVQAEDSVPESKSDSSPQDRPAKCPRRRRTSQSSRRHLLRTAAVAFMIVALALIATLVTDSAFFSPADAEAKVFTADKGQQSTVRLTDGTQVRLNVDSRLTIPEGFETDRREVNLEGEAFFDVAEDASRPFIVHAKNASVRVVGTAFNVRSYANTEKTRVAVSEGKVELKANVSTPLNSEDRDTTAVLLPHSLALASEQGMDFVREDVDLSRELAWTEGELVFEDASFEEVVRKLERWYDIQAKVEIPIEEIVGLNATFEDAALHEVLQNITAALNLKYKKDGQNITFYR